MIAQFGEFRLIERLTAGLGSDRSVRVGVGDDAAIVLPEPDTDLVLTVDGQVEGTHFLRDRVPPASVGHRALATNLSDLAAMGARARWALVALTLPDDLAVTWLDELYGGMESLARRHGVAIVGGNLARGGQIVIDVTAVGLTPRGRSLRRNAARPGDDILVTGWPGRSRAFLELLLTGRESEGRGMPALAEAHFRPVPRLAFGTGLLERGLGRAAIDISDGLLADLGHVIAASGCGATLDSAALPVDDETRWVGRLLATDPLEYVLRGGEAYELVVTATPAERAAIIALGQEYDLPVHRIGSIDAEPGLRLRAGTTTVEVMAIGHDHFGIGR